mgnify:CR=1 FL=1
MALLSEKNIILKVNKGDLNAFKDVYTHYSGMMYIFFSRKVKNEEDANDLVQELFIRLWKNKASIDASKPLKPYLYKVATNLAIDHLRKKVTLTNTIVYDNEEEGEVVLAEGFDVSDRINEEIARLPKQQREVFCLSRYENLKYKEIAETMNLSVKTVENHIGRALKTLRKNLSDLMIFILFTIDRFL